MKNAKNAKKGDAANPGTARPELSITVSVSGLSEMIDYCVDRTRRELERQVADAGTEKWLSPEQVSAMLGVDRTTLWRWKKQGYLKPAGIGGKIRYKTSDINKLLNE
jgi:predicted DNA-binding transcriptional regulator AlpA